MLRSNEIKVADFEGKHRKIKKNLITKPLDFQTKGVKVRNGI
jgi:hypothetical protein